MYKKYLILGGLGVEYLARGLEDIRQVWKAPAVLCADMDASEPLHLLQALRPEARKNLGCKSIG